jgi:tetratricopeptide (TPR) repeat protein
MSPTGANAHLSHARYYLRVLGRTNDLYVRGGEFVLAAIALFELEFANIARGQQWASCEADKSPEAAKLCLEYPNAGLYVLDLRLDTERRVRWLEAAVAAARRLNNRYYEAIRLGNLALAYADLGEYRQAIQLEEQSLAITREIGDRRAEAASLNGLGVCYDRIGERRRARDCFDQCLIIAREIDDQRGECSALVNLGATHAGSDEIPRSITLYNEGLMLARKIGDRRSEATTLGRLGLAYKKLGDVRQATTCYEQQLAIAREIGDRASEASALGNLGVIFYNSTQLNRAIECYSQQLSITRALGDRSSESIALGNLGSAYDDLGEPQSALNHYRDQLTIVRDAGDQIGEAKALLDMSITLGNLGEDAEAIECAEASLELYRALDDSKVSVAEEQIAQLKHHRTQQLISSFENQFGWPASAPETRRRNSTADKCIRILLVRGESPNGEQMYAYCAVRADRVALFMAAQKSGTFFPEDYSVIVESGRGEPSPEIKKKMELEYGFNHDQMQDLFGDGPQES